MAEFVGHGESCPGYFRDSPPGHSGRAAQFEVDGKPAVQGQRPEAIRVIVEDDYETSMYFDTLYAFGDDTAEKQEARVDRRIPKGNIITLDNELVEVLNAVCDDCNETERRSCPVLKMMIDPPFSTQNLARR